MPSSPGWSGAAGSERCAHSSRLAMAARKSKSASVPKRAPKAKETIAPDARAYLHSDVEAPARPAAGAQARFKKRKEPKSYRYDSSLAPELQWDGGNAGGRDRAEQLLESIRAAKSLEEAQAAATELAGLSKPFLNWAGKAEHLSFDVPTLPLFVHERLSTEAVLTSVRDRQVQQQISLFGDPGRSVADHVLKAYEHQDPWTNRMILGDSLVVMNSLLEYEGMGGKVQMIYIDPPYGVKFGSNFQPFVGKREVKHNDDNDLTREPEMVQAYRDTWELGLHSYLTYLRDRLKLARDLLTQSGSVFVQISDENLHHVREIMDEVFGPGNSVATIAFSKSSGATSELLPSTSDFILWYARSRADVKFRQPYILKEHGGAGASEYNKVLMPDGSRRALMPEEAANSALLPKGARVYRNGDLTSQGFRQFTTVPFEFQGRTYHPGASANWKTTIEGLQRLASLGRIEARSSSLAYVRFFDDFPAVALSNTWSDTGIAGRRGEKLYVVQTSPKVIERCIHMVTDPGDLVLDPTCGSGTSAFVAEKWGRRWITVDTSRVPLALARQRLLTATFEWYQLRDESRGPGGGFEYKRRQNARGEEVGGIVPHITLGSLANNEPPEEEVLVDRPEIVRGVLRVSGPFTVEATIPTPVDIDGDGIEDSGAFLDHASWVDRVIGILQRSPTLHLGGTRTVKLEQLRPPARTLALSAEATVDGNLVAIAIGPEHGSVSEKQVSEAGREAHQKSYSQLIVIGLAIEPNARALVDQGESVMGIRSTYVQATPDLLMGDLLKTMRSSQIFSVCGLPDIEVSRRDKDKKYQVTLRGLDIFDPVSMEVDESPGEKVPCWMLDQDYDGMVFRASQVFFPRTQAWDALQKALKADFDASVWEHLAGTTSTPFTAPRGKQSFTIAVKVIDPRGNELLVTREVAA